MLDALRRALESSKFLTIKDPKHDTLTFEEVFRLATLGGSQGKWHTSTVSSSTEMAQCAIYNKNVKCSVSVLVVSSFSWHLFWWSVSDLFNSMVCYSGNTAFNTQGAMRKCFQSCPIAVSQETTASFMMCFVCSLVPGWPDRELWSGQRFWRIEGECSCAWWTHRPDRMWWTQGWWWDAVLMVVL